MLRLLAIFRFLVARNQLLTAERELTQLRQEQLIVTLIVPLVVRRQVLVAQVAQQIILREVLVAQQVVL